VVVNENNKTCLECHENLPLSAFYRKAEYWHSRCKDCVLKHRKKYYSQKIKDKPTSVMNIVVDFCESHFNSNNNLMTVLESFLLEELSNEQRISR
jgi:hemerythrin